MATYEFTANHTPHKLHDEFAVAHPGKVSTIRSSGYSPTTPATSGAVIHDGVLTNAQIQSVIDSHTP